jgi:hypothetical protein
MNVRCFKFSVHEKKTMQFKKNCSFRGQLNFKQLTMGVRYGN